MDVRLDIDVVIGELSMEVAQKTRDLAIAKAENKALRDEIERLTQTQGDVTA